MFGIPKLLIPRPRAIALTLLGNALNFLVDFLFPAPTWGVYKAGTTTLAFEVSSVVELEISGEANLSDYQVEDGSFTVYNKVLTPNTFGIQLTRDGSQAQRGAFLNWLNTNLNNFELFDILCPERTYRNATLKGYRVNRSSSSGAAMIIADCIFQEIRQIPAAYTTAGVPVPENQPATPATRVSPVPNSTVQDFPP